MLFDLAWSEIALIGVVAVVVIGPKELPNAIKGIASGINKAKKSLRDFQSQADELVREANLTDVRDKIHEVRNTISDIRRFDIKGMVEKTVDGDGTIRNAMDGMSGSSSTPSWTPPATAATTPGAPDCIPPATLAPYIPPPPPATAATTDNAPEFLPPTTLTPQEWLAPKEEAKAEEPAPEVTSTEATPAGATPAAEAPSVIPPDAAVPEVVAQPAETRPANTQA
ncbi:twin-arginine translocase subunit TatB [Rhodovarius crocodyli]|uniref:Sec-independent protein translocase protein TatB n=1 Tax=Rhodovarius crocodyli TaxID=1979269 RepID=A0A437M2A6_9PROT|nr:Sec-independent protein translocase protein TatB [Rhodovarius crocodyli]RVT91817.1 twin-arginine translocase subunit TatB [Rhodovarius crocodyli]